MKAALLLLLWLPLVCAAQIAQPTDVDPLANKRAVALAEQLRCLVCQNQSIAESNAELAVDLRRQIREQIAEGRSDADINAYMVERYGDFVLYRPPVNGITLLLWFGPVVLLLTGIVALIRHVRSRRAQLDAIPLDADELRQAQALLGSREGDSP